MVPEPVAESEAGPDPEPVLPPGEEAAPVVEVVEVVAAPEPGPASPAEVAATSVAPPSDPGFLAPPPAATVRGPQTRPGERSPEAPTEFRALAPPPLHGGILAPPPPVRPLASVPTRSDTGAELRNAPSARSSGPVPAEPDADGGDDELPAKAFSLAPPPAYRSLQD